jgi:site-specific DNA-cytosine methylase
MNILDLFCGEGGSSEGYLRHPDTYVIGVDNDPKALEHMPRAAGRVLYDWYDAIQTFGDWADFVHASPPCQGYTWSQGRKMNGKVGASKKPLLIGAVRNALMDTGKPFVIENVPGSDHPRWELDGLQPNLRLSGDMFGLQAAFNPKPNESYKPKGESKCRDEWGCGNWATEIHLKLTRERLFECHGFKPAQRRRTYLDLPSLTIVSGSDTAGFHRLGHRDPTAEEAMRLFGIDPDHQMTKHGVAEAIPPVYTAFIRSYLTG